MANILYKSIQKINDGDEEAFVEIISKFYLMIKKFAKELKYEEAETDLIIYFIEIIKEIKIENLNIEHDEIDGAIISYIYNSMKNKKVDLFRKYVKGVKEELQINFDIIPSTENFSIVDKIVIKNALNKLTVFQRKVLILKFVYGYSDIEIAEKFQISRQAINKTKNRALNNLRKSLSTVY